MNALRIIIILHLSMGTKRKSAFGKKINNRYISYRGMKSEIQVYNLLCIL